jgi:amino-acid N-acetyltransferase
MERLSLKIALNQELEKALNLLQNQNLPTYDIDEKVELYTVYYYENFIGTIGLESFNTEGLLRSVSLDSSSQKKGFGTQILSLFEAKIQQKGIKNLYLLTTTAKGFFLKNKYQIVSREDVSEPIRQTAEFKGVCPSSAFVMKKEF